MWLCVDCAHGIVLDVMRVLALTTVADGRGNFCAASLVLVGSLCAGQSSTC